MSYYAFKKDNIVKTPPSTTSADYLEAMAINAQIAMPDSLAAELGITNELDPKSNFNGKSCYILGKVTGLPYPEVQAKFAAAEAILTEEGYRVYNPCNLVHPKTEWKDAMRTCIGIIIYCNAVYCLPCYEDSKGATLEHTIAQQLGLEMIYQL